MRIIIGNSKVKTLFENIESEDIVYHGGKAKFKQFDLAYVNTGAKLQEYGYGIYLAKDYDIALTYSNEGYIYTVEIPPISGKNYINLNKKLNSATKNKVLNSLFKYLCENDYNGSERELRDEFNTFDFYDGGDLYGTMCSYLGSAKDTSMFLNKLGYKGLVYDISRGHTCYVIFNPKDIKIKETDTPEEFKSRYGVINIKNDEEFNEFKPFMDEEFFNSITMKAYYDLTKLYTYDIVYKKDIKENQDDLSLLIIVFDTYGKLLYTYNKNGEKLNLKKSDVLKITKLKFKNLWYDKLSENVNNYKKTTEIENFGYIVNINNTNLYNVIDENNNLLFNKWYGVISTTRYNLLKINENDKVNIANLHGNLFFNKWVDNISVTKNGFIIVENNKKFYLCNINGNLIFNKPFTFLNDNSYFMRKRGYDNIVCYGKLGKKEIVINNNGEILYV